MLRCCLLLLAAVVSFWSTDLIRTADRSIAVTAAPIETVGETTINILPQDRVAADLAVDSSLRIGESLAWGIETKLWPDAQSQGFRARIIPFIVEAASRSGLPYDFLHRLLIRESGLRSDAVSPKGALGIAQFMPATAVERGLVDPFDPHEAVFKAAELLNEHRNRFGNLGLAAAAYNAGPGRVDRWLVGTSAMPVETRAYVRAITGRDIESWTSKGQWAALIDPPVAMPGTQPATSDTFTKALPGKVVSLTTLPAPSKARPAVADRSGKMRPLEQVVRSEHALCALMNEQGRTCLVRTRY